MWLRQTNLIVIGLRCADGFIIRNHEIFRYDAVYFYMSGGKTPSARHRCNIKLSKLRERIREFQTEKHFDEDLPTDVEEVLDVAAALDIKEFDVFHLAYDWWHGEKSTDTEIEPIFAKYMFNSVVPPWVRQFTRMALQLRDEDRLDPHVFGVQQEPADAKMVSQGIRYSIILVMSLGALFMLAYLSRDLIFTYAYCMFPPCY